MDLSAQSENLKLFAINFRENCRATNRRSIKEVRFAKLNMTKELIKSDLPFLIPFPHFILFI